MKRTYIKPNLIVEEFALTQQIAACSLNIGFGDAACVINDIDSTPQIKDFAAMGMFTTPSLCAIPATVGQEFDGICYHTNVQSIFSS